jgi:hypothetical protein
MASYSAKYLDENGLLYYNQKLNAKFNDKVDKVEGKGLSTNDLTDELKQKILDAGDSSFNGSYTALTDKPKINNITIDGELSLDDLGIQKSGDYTTSDDVNKAIGDALEGITGIDFKIVESLPETGEKGIIYLVSNNGKDLNIYDEYIWLSDSSSFEKIGSTDIDLSNYWSKTDLIAIDNTDIDTIVGG